MNLSQMKMFVEVAELGSFSEVARANGLTQPAVTRKMQRLEKELGIELFERSEGNYTTLTSMGRDFVTFSLKTLQEYAILQESWRVQRNEVQGTFKLGASTTPGEYLVPGLLADFTARYPKVQPNLMILDSLEIENRVLAREFDAGFIGRASQKPQLVCQQVAQDEILLIVPANHKLTTLAKNGAVELHQLEGQIFLEREEGSGTMQSVHQILAASGKTMPAHRVAMALGSTQAVTASVAAGLGIGFVSYRAIHNQPGRVVPLRLNNLPLVRSLYLIYESDKPEHGSLLIRQFIRFVVAQKEALDSANPELAEED